jgi:hypothetical protein
MCREGDGVMRDFLKILLWAWLLLGVFFFWATQCGAQTTFVRDQINTTRLTVLGSERLFFSNDSTAPAVGYVKLWARDSTSLFLIRSSGVRVNLLSTVIDTSVLATQYDISLKSAAFGTIDTAGLAVNKILKWNGSAWIVRNDSVGTGSASDSTTWIATDYDVSLKLNKTDTLSLSNRINLKLTASDTASLSSRINTKADSSTVLYWADTTLANGPVTDFDISTKANLTAVLKNADSTTLKNSLLKNADSTTLKNSLLKNADSTTLKNSILSAVLKNADSTTLKNSLLKNADSTTLKNSLLKNADSTTLKNSLLKNADSTTLKNSLLKNADSTSIRNYSNTLYATPAQVGAKADSSTVLYWADTTLSNGVATNFDLPVYRLDTVTAALDTLLVTVASVTRVLASIAGTGITPPIPVRAYVKDATHYVLKFDYDLTANQPIEVSYWR